MTIVSEKFSIETDNGTIEIEIDHLGVVWIKGASSVRVMFPVDLGQGKDDGAFLSAEQMVERGSFSLGMQLAQNYQKLSYHLVAHVKTEDDGDEDPNITLSLTDNTDKKEGKVFAEHKEVKRIFL